MRLTRQEVEDLNLNIKAWTGAMQLATKKTPAPCFELKGPCQLTVRKRSTKTGSVATASGRMPFMGGEKFNLASVSVTNNRTEGNFQIDVSFVPADMTLIGAISGMSMSLADAIEHFDSFEDWVTAMKDEAPPATVSRPKPKPLVQQHAENPLWGSW